MTHQLHHLQCYYHVDGIIQNLVLRQSSDFYGVKYIKPFNNTSKLSQTKRTTLNREFTTQSHR